MTARRTGMGISILQDPRALAVGCRRDPALETAAEISAARVFGAVATVTGRLRGGFHGRGMSWPLEVAAGTTPGGLS